MGVRNWIVSLFFLIACGGAVAFSVGCITNKGNEHYIDFLKISDKTYLGVTEVISNLDVPWDMQYNAVTNSIFFTEIKGQISELNLKNNTRKVIYTVPNVYQQRTLGLLGLAIHPNFKNKPYLYVCYTTKEGERIFSELLRLRYDKDTISETKVLLKIDGAKAHNGSRLSFDKEGLLYWATGDAASKTHSQDSTTLNGKILRMTDDGRIPADNPIKGSYVYAWGFRNIQGLAVTANGNIIASEHGDAIEDELNWIRPLHNYGWKNIEGFHDLEEEKAYAAKYNTTEPIKSWTPVIAPAAVYYNQYKNIREWDNVLFLGTLKNQSLHILKLNSAETEVVDEKVYFKDHYGRIRAITGDKNGDIYIATSNRDWKKQENFPLETDDRILKLSKVNFVPEQYLEEAKEEVVDMKDGKALYQAYCASCHGNEGAGVEGIFPPLKQNTWVEDESKFLNVVLHGLEGKIEVDGKVYDQVMPAFNFLQDGEIATIVNYVRKNFGNNYKEVSMAKVQEMRNKTTK